MMNIEIAVVLMLNSKASTATGEVTARQAPLSTVQMTRLRMGRLIKPATRARAATARPEASLSPQGGLPGVGPSLPRSFKPLARSSTSSARAVPDVDGVVARVAESGVGIPYDDPVDGSPHVGLP